MTFKFTYDVDYDYDTYTRCDSGCDPYCRCGVIQNTRINSVDASGMADTVQRHQKGHKKHAKDPIWLYALERVCSIYKPEDFEVNVCGGYYGEEVNNVTLEDESVIHEFLLLKTSTEWIEFALQQEYGHVLPALANKQWKISKVDISSIHIPNDYRKLDKKSVKQYESELKNNVDFLTVFVDENSKLIDGYHRYQASLNKKKRKIYVIQPV